MPNVGVLGDVEVAKDSPRCHNGTVHRGYAEAFEIARLEVLEQAVGSRFLGENPVLKLKSKIPCSESIVELLAETALYQHLLGRKIAQ